MTEPVSTNTQIATEAATALDNIETEIGNVLDTLSNSSGGTDVVGAGGLLKAQNDLKNLEQGAAGITATVTTDQSVRQAVTRAFQ